MRKLESCVSSDFPTSSLRVLSLSAISATLDQAASDVRSGIRSAKRGAINALRAEGLSIVVCAFAE